VGNDIAENKRTYPAILLWQRATENDKQILHTIFGKKEITQTDLDLISTLLGKYHVMQDLQETIDELSGQAIQRITTSLFQKRNNCVSKKLFST